MNLTLLKQVVVLSSIGIAFVVTGLILDDITFWLIADAGIIIIYGVLIATHLLSLRKGKK